MAKKEQKVDDSKTKLESTIESLNKSYGVGTVLTLNEDKHGSYDVISSGSIGFDHVVLGIGGFAKGKLYELMGWEACLSEDTYIKFINVREDGIVQDCKGGTIKNLYERFHSRTDKTIGSTFNVTSINEENRVFRNEIADVVKTGRKECFELTTSLGYKIKATKDHKFFTGHSYTALENLRIGDIVYIHNNTPFRVDKKIAPKRYTETTIKYYYRGKPRLINGSWYFRESVHRLTFEAVQNGITYEEYKSILNSGSLPKDFWTIPEGYEIHHIDENTKNNSIENLQMFTSSEHSRNHAFDRHNNLRFVAVEDKISSIVSIGEQETYDIKCYYPYNNYIAEGIVVHNSGKSTICGHVMAECQKAGGVGLYIDGEHAFDKDYFQALGVDIEKMLFAQPSSGEEGFNIALQMIKTGMIDLVIIDSDSSLIPKAVVDGEVGDSSIGKKARLNNNAYPSIKAALALHKVCVIVVSQYREKIGVMFGNPTTTQGGHALKFYTDGRIEVSKTLAKEGEDIYGNLTKIKCTKNKMFPPYKKCEFDIVYGQGIDKIQEIIDLAVNYGIIQKSGSWFSYGETKIGQGDTAVHKLLSDNEEFCEELKEKILNKIKGIEDNEQV